MSGDRESGADVAIADAASWPVSPFVRRRWRRRLGLPDVFVVEVGVPGAPELDERAARDALFLCAAAVVGPSHLLAALALGTPTVCTRDAAAAVGAEDGVHVVVADEDAHDVALALAADDERAALLARAGRALLSERRGVATSSGSASAGPVLALVSALADLGTPAGSDVVRHVSAHVASLGPSAAAAVAPLWDRAEAAATLPDEASAERVAAAFGLPRAAGEVTPAPPPRTIRQRLAGKSAGDIAQALLRRARLLR